MLLQVIIKRMILQFIVVASGVARKGDMILLCGYLRVGRFK